MDDHPVRDREDQRATTTLNTYAHLWPTAEDRTRKAAESILAASLGRTDARQTEVD